MAVNVADGSVYDSSQFHVKKGWKFHVNCLLALLKYLSDLNEPRSDRRDLLAVKVKSEIFTEKERPSCCEQFQKI